MSGTTLTLAWLGTVMLAWFIRRNPAYPAFVAVSLGVTTLSTAGLFLNHAQP